MEPFDVLDTYAHLPDGPAVTLVPVSPDFWQTIDRRTDLHGGRLMTATRFEEAGAWDHWERHPAGDELVILLSGSMDLVLASADGERRVTLRPRQAFLVPRGTWHRGIARVPSEALFLTRGEGTDHRPVTEEERHA